MRVGFQRVSAPLNRISDLFVLKSQDASLLSAKRARINRIQAILSKCTNLISDFEFLNNKIGFMMGSFDPEGKYLELKEKTNKLQTLFKDLMNQVENDQTKIVTFEENQKNDSLQIEKLIKENSELKKKIEANTERIKLKKATALQTVFEIELIEKQKQHLIPKIQENEKEKVFIDNIYYQQHSDYKKLKKELKSQKQISKQLVFTLSAKNAIFYHILENNETKNEDTLPLEEKIQKISENEEEIHHFETEISLKESQNEASMLQLKNLKNEINQRHEYVLIALDDIKEEKEKKKEYLQNIEQNERIVKEMDEKMMKIDSQQNEIKEELEIISNNNISLSENKENVKQQIKQNENLENEIKSLEEEISSLQSHLESINKEIISKNDEIDQIKKQLEEKENNLTNQQTNLIRKPRKRSFLQLNW